MFIYCLIKVLGNTLRIENFKPIIGPFFSLLLAFFFLNLLQHKMHLFSNIKKTCFFIHDVCQFFILNINLLEWEIRNLNGILVTYKLFANSKLYAIVT